VTGRRTFGAKSRSSNPEPHLRQAQPELKTLDPNYIDARLEEAKGEITRMLADIRTAFSQIEAAKNPVSLTNCDWWSIVTVLATLLAKTYTFNDAQTEQLRSALVTVENRIRTIEKASRS